jgi:PAS domain S-box-containing protein
MPVLDEFETSIAQSSIAFVVTDPRRPDNPAVALNEAFRELTLYEPGEVLGRNLRFLQGPESEADQRAAVRLAIERHQPGIVQMTNYRKDGTTFVNAMMIAPVFDYAGALAFYLGSQVALESPAERAWEERRRRAREAIAALSPRQGEVLRALALGHRNRRIAQSLRISENTVKMHRTAMMAKLGAATLAEAIRLAIEAGE